MLISSSVLHNIFDLYKFEGGPTLYLHNLSQKKQNNLRQILLFNSFFKK